MAGIPHYEGLCQHGQNCFCACARCAQGEHDAMTEIRVNEPEQIEAARRRARVEREGPRETLGELWTQLEALFPPEAEFYLSRQPENAASRRYVAETYDTRLVGRTPSHIGEGSTPERAINALINLMLMTKLS